MGGNFAPEYAAYTLGEQAHIVGEKEDAPRGHSPLTLGERNTYHNLILLCPTHHAEIDKNEESWPIEKLHQVKSEHELWVMETLSESVDLYKLAQEVVVTNIVDSAVEFCDLENWTVWTSNALRYDPHWQRNRPEQISEFRQKVCAAIWPDGFDELRRSATTLAVLLDITAKTFMVHSELHGDTYGPSKFYEKRAWNENYHRDLERYEKWKGECYQLIWESTKATNWFADVVRRDVNPMFFADKGKFIIFNGPVSDYSNGPCLLEFEEQEKDKLPDVLFKV
jgi:hypothetical protein